MSLVRVNRFPVSSDQRFEAVWKRPCSLVLTCDVGNPALGQKSACSCTSSHINILGIPEAMHVASSGHMIPRPGDVNCYWLHLAFFAICGPLLRLHIAQVGSAVTRHVPEAVNPQRTTVQLSPICIDTASNYRMPWPKPHVYRSTATIMVCPLCGGDVR
jgi:hypothetical protein